MRYPLAVLFVKGSELALVGAVAAILLAYPIGWGLEAPWAGAVLLGLAGAWFGFEAGSHRLRGRSVWYALAIGLWLVGIAASLTQGAPPIYWVPIGVILTSMLLGVLRPRDPVPMRHREWSVVIAWALTPATGLLVWPFNSAGLSTEGVWGIIAAAVVIFGFFVALGWRSRAPDVRRQAHILLAVFCVAAVAAPIVYALMMAMLWNSIGF